MRRGGASKAPAFAATSWNVNGRPARITGTIGLPAPDVSVRTRHLFVA
jgi:hypothetical protein